MANYVINYRDGAANTTVTLTPGNAEVLGSLNLMGQGYANYGTNLNQNWVSIAESFASNSTITNPVTGQLWWNNNELKLNTGSQVSPIWNPLVVSNVTTNLYIPNISSNTLSANTANIGVIIGNIGGDGGNLTNLNASNLATGTVPVARMSGSYNISISGLAGTAVSVTGNAQPNITSVGTLSSLAVSGNITAANLSGGNLVGANFLAGTLITPTQPNITTVGALTNLSVIGNTGIGGNLTVSGTIIGNISGNISGNITVPGNTTEVIYNNLGQASASNRLRFTGTSLVVLGDLDATTLRGNGANLATLTGANVTGIVPNANYSAFSNLSSFSNVASAANTIAGPNVTGQVSNAVVAGTVYTSAQPNITSVGTLTSLSVTGTTTSGTYVGSGSGLTTLNASNISGGTLSQSRLANDSIILGNTTATLGATVLNITGLNGVTATTFTGALNGTAATATTAGTVTTAAQPNITSVGTLSSLTVSGNANVGGDVRVNGTLYANVAGNIVAPGANTQVLLNQSGQVGASGNLTFNGTTLGVAGTVNSTLFNGSGAGLTNIPGANVTGTVPSATTATTAGSATTAGTVTTAAQPNITSVGTLSALSVSGTTTSGTFSGSGASLTNIPGANVTGTVPLSSVATTVSAAAQPNITSVGTLTSLTVSGQTQTGTLRTTTITTGANTTAGSFTGTWTLTAGSRLDATYADLAEYYSGDQQIEPATVVSFGGEYEVTTCMEDHSSRVAGVVTTNPAYVMNSNIAARHNVAIALTGRVPCKVVGTLKAGDLLVSAGNGCARGEENPRPGTILGKAICGKHTSEMEIIEVVVGWH